MPSNERSSSGDVPTEAGARAWRPVQLPLPVAEFSLYYDAMNLFLHHDLKLADILPDVVDDESERQVLVDYTRAIRVQMSDHFFAFTYRGLERDAVINARLTRLEDSNRHAVQPALRKLARHLEYAEKDAEPAAASAQYEWLCQVREAQRLVDEMLLAFDDLETRLSRYVALIDKARDLLKFARATDSRYLRDAVLTIHDVLCGVYSEDLTLDQANVIKVAVSRLVERNWDLDMVRALDRMLRDSDFETVPSDRFRGRQGGRTNVSAKTAVR